MATTKSRRLGKTSKPEPDFITSLAQIAAMSGLIFSALLAVMVLASLRWFVPSRDLPFVLGALGIECVLIGLTLLVGTFSMRRHARTTHRAAQGKLRILEIGNAPIDPEVAATAQTDVPPFAVLLKRNAIAAVFFGPATLIISLAVFALMELFLTPGPQPSTQSSTTRSLLTILVVLPLYGWLFAEQFSWRRITQFVDNRILHTTTNLSEQEKAEPTQPEYQPTAEPNKVPFVVRLLLRLMKIKAVGAVIGVILFLVIFSPMYLGPALLQGTTLPNNVQTIGSILLVIGYPLALGVLGVVVLPRAARRLQVRVVKNVVNKAAAQSPEKAEALQRDLKTFETQANVVSTSFETRFASRSYILILGGFVVVLALGFVAGLLARQAGASADSAKLVFGLVALAGMFSFFALYQATQKRWAPKSRAQTLLLGWEDAIHRGDYDTALPMVDKAMSELPNWETKIPGAAAYAQAGRFAEAERIARQILQDVAPLIDEQDHLKPLHRQIMSNASGILAEVLIAEERLDEAEEAAKHALEFTNPKSAYTANKTFAKLSLLRRRSDVALSYLDAAIRAYTASRKQPTGYTLALKAWALAQKGDILQADSLMEEAFKRVPPEQISNIAELHLTSGYIAQAEKKPMAARDSFRKAIEMDKGLFGLIAQRELDKMRNN